MGELARHSLLAASGAGRRFAQDPAAGWLALSRAIPGVQDRAPLAMDAPARLDRAVAADRYDDAVAILAEVPADDPARASCEMSVRRIGGHLTEVADSTSPTDARGRRTRANALRQRADLLSALPSWATRRPSAFSSNDAEAPARILHVVNNSLPRTQAGSTIRTHSIARAQRGAGWDARVVTRPGYPVLRGSLTVADEEIYDAVTYRHLLPATLPSGDAYFDAYRRLLLEVVDSWKPHVLHAASDHVNARAALEAGRLRGIPVAYEARSLHEDTWLAAHAAPGAEDSDTYRWMRERHTEVMLAADVVTTLSVSMKDDILARGVDAERVFVVPNAVDMRFLAPIVSPEVARTALGLQSGFWIGTVTSVNEHEGLETAVDAAAILRSRGLDARMLVVGEGPALAALRLRAESAGVPLVTPGRVPFADVREYYDALDVFVLPRKDTRLGRRVTALKPLEAQARGVPVVGSDLPAVAEVLAPGSALVAPEDPAAWADALAALADPAARATAGSSARDWIASCRTWPAVVEAYRDAYAFLGAPVG